MSMELFVILAGGQAPDVTSWNRALASAQVPVVIAEDADLSKSSGFVPVTVAGKPSGFRRFDVGSFSDLASRYPGVARLKIERPVVYEVGYGSSDECAAVFYSISVLVERFGGIAFEPQGSIVMSAEELRDAARECQAMASEDAQ
ncbi:hypothetical protein HNQ60_005360 [Povalibacter uvarum]|uniref:Uncharacterized protein n=1 Tax=Povalibacter uvarum TaxID=732238 RepID=A0A841HWZ3_9GAMM|nr:hypothetical protein [Povalibacter uvarum]MBB6096438.1 hypothetical protein [Povalibacter uvarum]